MFQMESWTGANSIPFNSHPSLLFLLVWGRWLVSCKYTAVLRCYYSDFTFVITYCVFRSFESAHLCAVPFPRFQDSTIKKSFLAKTHSAGYWYSLLLPYGASLSEESAALCKLLLSLSFSALGVNVYWSPLQSSYNIVYVRSFFFVSDSSITYLEDASPTFILRYLLSELVGLYCFCLAPSKD